MNVLLFATHATKPDIAVFVLAAIMVMAGAIGVVVSRNPVHSALSLVTTLFGIAVLFVLQSAQFLAAVQIIVYAGAIVVLFLFVIMLLGVDRPEVTSKDKLLPLRFVGPIVAVSVGALVLATGKFNWKAIGESSVGGPLSGPGSNVAKLADTVFDQYLFAFEATSLLLVIAVVGAVVLSRGNSAGALAGLPLEVAEPGGLFSFAGDGELDADATSGVDSLEEGVVRAKEASSEESRGELAAEPDEVSGDEPEESR